MRQLVVVALLAVAGVAWGAPSPAEKCQALKNQEAGKYVSCLHKAEARLLKTRGTCSLTTATACYDDGDCPGGETCTKDLAKYVLAVTECESKFAAKWANLTQKATDQGGACPDALAASEIEAVIDACVTNVSGGLAGDGLANCGGELTTCQGDLTAALACGNGVVEAGEDCDQADLNDATCASEGLAGPGLRCGPDCVFDTSDCYATRYVDNGDGTISDNRTGLMWEKKSLDGSVHELTHDYTWSTASTSFLATLNAGGGFAGHTDWRLPTLEEWETLRANSWQTASGNILNSAFRVPCLPDCSVTSCSCSIPGRYWSSSARGGGAYTFDVGDASEAFRDQTDSTNRVRAVRGGS